VADVQQVATEVIQGIGEADRVLGGHPLDEQAEEVDGFPTRDEGIDHLVVRLQHDAEVEHGMSELREVPGWFPAGQLAERGHRFLDRPEGLVRAVQDPQELAPAEEGPSETG
jgi:hypothetical protein